MSEVIVVERSLETIADEINGIKRHVQEVALISTIRIGQMLVEAKKQLNHGEWGNWLKNSVSYSQSTATNAMNLYEVYKGKIAENANFDYTKLNPSQALALLGLPAEEMDQFAIENEIDQKSTSEIKRLIKEREEAEERAKTAESEARQEREARERLEREAEESEKELERMAKEARGLQEQLEAAQASGDAEEVQKLQKALEKSKNDANTYMTKVKELEKKLEETPVEVPAPVVEIKEVVPEEVTNRLEALTQERDMLLKQATINSSETTIMFNFQYKQFADAFNGMLDSFDIMNDEERTQFKGALSKALAGMVETLEQ